MNLSVSIIVTVTQEDQEIPKNYTGFTMMFEGCDGVSLHSPEGVISTGKRKCGITVFETAASLR